jgi:hypothetical protein
MQVTIDLSEQDASALEAQAREAQMPPERYLSKVVERALHVGEAAEEPRKPRKSAYGLLAKYGPGPTEEEIEENRREMFRGFGELAL